MRLLWIFLGLSAVLLVPLLMWGEQWETAFSHSGTIEWLRRAGDWAWAAGILLLIADIVLPVPGTAVIAGLGYVYGALLGGIIGSVGSFLSGTIAYWLCRGIGRKAAIRLLGEKDFARGQRLFSNVGGWAIVLSRWLPLLPEVVACMAGLTRMPARTFFISLACGSLPLGFTFAGIGSAGIRHPWIALVLSAIIPPVLWVIVGRIIRRYEGRNQP